MLCKRVSVALAFMAFTALPCAGQYTVKRIVFRGAAPYTQQQLEQVADLPKGSHVGSKEMGEAAQRLMDTGVFADVTSSANGPVSGIDIIFQIKLENPAAFIPVRFTNLVWFSDEDLDRQIRERVPLYTGRIPRSGNMQEQVRTALVAMIAAKGVTATVESEQIETNVAVPTPQFVYKVTNPSIVFGRVSLQGVQGLLSAQSKAGLSVMAGKPYNSGSRASLSAGLLYEVRDSGFIDAKLDELDVTPSAATGGRVSVDVSGTVSPGEMYHVTSITWSGTDQFSAEQFAKVVQLHPGDVASQTALTQSITPITNAYLAKGYLDAKLDVDDKRDRTAHTVAYTITVQPGEVYHVGSVTTTGLSATLQRDFDAAWKLKAGDVYDPSYPLVFMEHLPSSLEAYKAVFTAQANTQVHTADVAFIFTPLP